MKNLKFLALYILFLFIIAPIQNAKPSALFSLRGISAIAVRVDGLPHYMITDGTNELSIKKNVEKQLREAKLRVVEYEEWEKTLGGCYLNVKIVPSKSYSGDQYVIYAQIELKQTVTLIRHQVEQNKLITANTWQAGKLMNCATESVDECMQNGIKQIVEIFITEIKKVN